MSELHIEYLKSLCSTISLDGQQPFVSAQPGDLAQGRFLETRPPLDKFQELIPCVVVQYYPLTPARDGRRAERLDRSGDNLRFLRCEYQRQFRYRLDFWMNDPAQEVLSNQTEVGITEQIQLYVIAHERFMNQLSTVTVALGPSGLVEDPDRSNGLFYVYQEILFQDDLCLVEEVPSLAGKQIQVKI